jgi:hypothetical protein
VGQVFWKLEKWRVSLKIIADFTFQQYLC